MIPPSLTSLAKLFLFQKYKPSYLLFFVTNRCEASCSHCFYWKKRNTKTKELTLDQITEFAMRCGPLVQVTLTGGSPDLRQDLSDIAIQFWKYCSPINMTLCSNGNDPEKLFADVHKICQLYPYAALTVDISLDGLHEEHDQLRGIDGLFDNVIRSYRLLHNLRSRYPNLRLGCGLCVSGLNTTTAYATACWAMENLPLDNFTPVLVRGEPRASEALQVDSKVFLLIANEVESRLRKGAFKGYARYSGIINRKDIIQKRLIYSIYNSRKSPIRCSAAYETAVVYPDGSVGVCELRNEILGYLNDVDMDITAIWRSPQTKKLRVAIKNEKCYCWHQCFLSPTIVKSPRLWVYPV
jgi:hypothetical protein